jgi:F-box protein 11
VITNVIPGGSVLFELHSVVDPSPLRIEIDGYNEQSPPVSIKAVIDVNNDHRQDLVEAFGRSSDFYRWGRPVAAVFFPKPDGVHDETNCTIFLITESIALTNSHCLTEPWQVTKSRVIFGLESRPVGTLEDSVAEVITPDPNSELDFELLRLSKAVRDWGIVTLGTEPHKKQEFILIQHPDGGVKKIASKCKLAKQRDKPADPEFFHLCDSSGGSSGSPVMDISTGTVVRIHHIAVYGSSPKDVRNLAVKMSNIMRLIQSTKPGLYAEIAKSQPSLP